MVVDHAGFIESRIIMLFLLIEISLEHARFKGNHVHASLVLKCWILIVLFLIWSSSNLLMIMMMFLGDLK